MIRFLSDATLLFDASLSSSCPILWLRLDILQFDNVLEYKYKANANHTKPPSTARRADDDDVVDDFSWNSSH